jgi:demethylspheroidene O-methyltransferase
MAQAPSDAPNAATQTDAYFHFYLLAMGAGRLRTPEELMRLMVQAGFKKPRRMRNALPVHAQILCAQK